MAKKGNEFIQLHLLTTTSSHTEKIKAKPFLKWAGGKKQLLRELYKRIPPYILEQKRIERYIEPFVGGGAFFFFLKKNFGVNEPILIDTNNDLVVAYKVIKKDVDKLISKLEDLEMRYFEKFEKQKEFYYKIRDRFNESKRHISYEEYDSSWIKHTAFLIFLNKTCFNGLYRVNKKGEFNVPFGRHKRPNICDSQNLLEVSKALEGAKIFCDDFESSEKYVAKNVFVYLDPPYRPLNSTANFTSYNNKSFDDEEQIRLSNYFKRMSAKGAYLLLSNSDPKNVNKEDNFFDEIYSEFIIERVKARRHINSKGNKRGHINELIIRNYKIGE